jgi:hypothetical protein
MGEIFLVISSDKNVNQEIYDTFQHDLLDKGVRNEHLGILNELLETARNKRFPGAILPIMNSQRAYSAIYVYEDVSDWYKFAPIIKAFSGPSFSSFNGEHSTTDLNALLDRHRRSLLMHYSICEIKLELGKGNYVAVRSLNRAVTSYLGRPNLYSEIPLPTPFLIRNFEEALLIGDKREAWKIIDTLEKNFKLDSMNLRFMEIQLFAQFGEWKKIVNLPDFKDICTARKTSVIFNFILKALIETYINLSDPIDQQLVAYEEHISNFSEFLFNSSTVVHIDPENAILLAFEASLDPTGFNYYAELECILPTSHPSRSLIQVQPKSVATLGSISNPLSSILKALSNLKEIEGAAYRSTIRNQYAQLSEADQAVINNFISIHTQFQEMDLTEQCEPQNWSEWFDRISDQGYTEYSAHAQVGASEWTSLSDDLNSNLVEKIYFTINNALDDDLISERILECLPYFVKWILGNEEELKRPPMRRVYSGLITLIALRSAQNTLETLGSSQIIIGALLDCGIDRESYIQLLDDLDVITGEGIGVSQVYWLLDLVEMLYEHPTSDNEVRNSFFHKVGGKITSIYRRLSEGQRQTVDILFDELGLNKPVVDPVVSTNETDYWAKLENKKIGIYTLTETAGKRAAQMIQKIVPSVNVTVNSHHAGSNQLKALSENADFFVVSWLSAKHAATDFIRQHRSAENIIYAQGKGASSIIRSLESALLNV